MPAPAATPWHARTVEAVLAELQTSATGLSQDEAGARRATHGRNVLVLTPPTPAWQILVHQFRGIIVALLGAAAVLAWLTADPLDADAAAIAIAIVLVLNVALGFARRFAPGGPLKRCRHSRRAAPQSCGQPAGRTRPRLLRSMRQIWSPATSSSSRRAIPLRQALHTTPLRAQEWLLIVALAVVPALMGQALRMCRRRNLLHSDSH